MNREQGKLNMNTMNQEQLIQKITGILREELTKPEGYNPESSTVHYEGETVKYGLLPATDGRVELPSQLQPRQVAKLCFFQMMLPLTVTVRTVHFTLSKVKYDVDVWLPDDTTTRIYNVDSVFLTPA